MKSIKKMAALMAALFLLFTAAQAESWTWAQDNQERFNELFALLGSAENSEDMDTAEVQRVLDGIRSTDETDYEIARAVADHWNNTVLNPEYTPVYVWKYKQDGRFYYRCIVSNAEAPDGMDNDQRKTMARSAETVETVLKDAPVSERRQTDGP